MRAFPPRSHLGYVPLTSRIRQAEQGSDAAVARDEHCVGGREGEGAGEQPSVGGGEGEGAGRVKGGGSERGKPELWLFTGLGSRGLIHHALLGRAVASAVLAGDEELLFEHTRRVRVRTE